MFSLLYLIYYLYGFKSYFKSASSLTEDIKKSRAKLRDEKGKETENMVVGAVALFVLVEGIIRIAFSATVAIYMGHGWLMLLSAFNAVWAAIWLVPRLLRVTAGEVKRSFIGTLLQPINTIFLAYLVYLFVH